PMPTPWIIRQQISIQVLTASPLAIEAATRTISATCIIVFLSSWSDSLPQIGVVTVIMNRLAMKISVVSVAEAPRSTAIAGSALATTVAASIAVPRAESSPATTVRISRWLSSAAGPWPADPVGLVADSAWAVAAAGTGAGPRRCSAMGVLSSARDRRRGAAGLVQTLGRCGIDHAGPSRTSEDDGAGPAPRTNAGA